MWGHINSITCGFKCHSLNWWTISTLRRFPCDRFVEWQWPRTDPRCALFIVMVRQLPSWPRGAPSVLSFDRLPHLWVHDAAVLSSKLEWVSLQQTQGHNLWSSSKETQPALALSHWHWPVWKAFGNTLHDCGSLVHQTRLHWDWIQNKPRYFTDLVGTRWIMYPSESRWANTAAVWLQLGTPASGPNSCIPKCPLDTEGRGQYSCTGLHVRWQQQVLKSSPVCNIKVETAEGDHQQLLLPISAKPQWEHRWPQGRSYFAGSLCPVVISLIINIHLLTGAIATINFWLCPNCQKHQETQQQDVDCYKLGSSGYNGEPDTELAAHNPRGPIHPIIPLRTPCSDKSSESPCLDSLTFCSYLGAPDCTQLASSFWSINATLS